ncbi:MAG: hypothetical protein WD894_01290 [Pirellulales bacterium]
MNFRIAILHAISGTLSLVLPLSAATAQDAGEKQKADKAVIDHWLEVSKKYATEYEIAPADDRKAVFKLVPEPIFRHTQSVRGDDIGALHVWVEKDGRPAVVGVMFAWSLNDTSRRTHVEFHSLHAAPIAAKFRDRELWQSRTPGLEWRDFPADTPAPAATPARRRSQVRQLARRFEAHTVDNRQKRWELRQVATPIFEYEVDAAGTLGGALFAFCQGTDTELLLVVEARKVDGRRQFRYAYASFTDYDVFLKMGDQAVVQAPKGNWSENGNPHFFSAIEVVPKPEFERGQ